MGTGNTEKGNIGMRVGNRVDGEYGDVTSAEHSSNVNIEPNSRIFPYVFVLFSVVSAKLNLLLS